MLMVVSSVGCELFLWVFLRKRVEKEWRRKMMMICTRREAVGTRWWWDKQSKWWNNKSLNDVFACSSYHAEGTCDCADQVICTLPLVDTRQRSFFFFFPFALPDSLSLSLEARRDRGGVRE